jgi:hypothetical protein
MALPPLSREVPKAATILDLGGHHWTSGSAGSEEQREILLGHAELSAELVHSEFFSADPASDRFRGDAELACNVFYGEKARGRSHLRIHDWDPISLNVL